MIILKIQLTIFKIYQSINITTILEINMKFFLYIVEAVLYLDYLAIKVLACNDY